MWANRAEDALDLAPVGSLVVVMLHHHLHALPEDDIFDRLSSLVGWPNAAELPLGGALLARLLGRCDLVLHGHRHTIGELRLNLSGARPLRVLNAGASPELGRVRILSHAAGRVVGERWLGPDGEYEVSATAGAAAA